MTALQQDIPFDAEHPQNTYESVYGLLEKLERSECFSYAEFAEKASSLRGLLEQYLTLLFERHERGAATLPAGAATSN